MSIPFREAECTAGGHKEMPSILADQSRPRIWAQMRGGGLWGLSQVQLDPK